MTNRFKILYKAAIVVLAVICAMGIGAVVLVAIGADVFRAYSVILFEPLKNISLVSEVLLRTIPLTIIALGITVAYRSGFINIGAEGQMAMGIIAATAAAVI